MQIAKKEEHKKRVFKYFEIKNLENIMICMFKAIRYSLCKKCPNTDQKKNPYLDIFHAVIVS